MTLPVTWTRGRAAIQFRVREKTKKKRRSLICYSIRGDLSRADYRALRSLSFICISSLVGPISRIDVRACSLEFEPRDLTRSTSGPTIWISNVLVTSSTSHYASHIHFLSSHASFPFPRFAYFTTPFFFPFPPILAPGLSPLPSSRPFRFRVPQSTPRSRPAPTISPVDFEYRVLTINADAFIRIGPNSFSNTFAWHDSARGVTRGRFPVSPWTRKPSVSLFRFQTHAERAGNLCATFEFEIQTIEAKNRRSFGTPEEWNTVGIENSRKRLEFYTCIFYACIFRGITKDPPH